MRLPLRPERLQEAVTRIEREAAAYGAARRKMVEARNRISSLSPREREVARALSEGHSHKEVARLLGLAPATVRNQTQSIYHKLGVDNRASLSAMLNQGS